MKILAIEWSSGQRSVALHQTGAASAGGVVASERVEKEDRSGRGLGLVEAVLKEAGVEPSQVECLAIGLGPGSYTGVRAAIALAQGWSLVRDVRLAGISSAEAVAAQAQAQGMLGRTLVVIDAQRNEFYVASYEIVSDKILQLEPLRLASRAELECCLKDVAQAIGPDQMPTLPSIHLVHPRASVVAALAAQRTDSMSPDQLTPIYLREVSFVKAPPARIVR